MSLLSSYYLISDLLPLNYFFMLTHTPYRFSLTKPTNAVMKATSKMMKMDQANLTKLTKTLPTNLIGNVMILNIGYLHGCYPPIVIPNTFDYVNPKYYPTIILSFIVVTSA